MMWWVMFQERSPDFADLFKLWRSTRRESEGCEVQNIYNSERWTGNSNNDCGEEAEGFAGSVQEKERTYI